MLQSTPAPTGAKPLPVSASTVAVNVCDWPTALVAFGAIVIAALTHSFDAFGPSPGCASPVCRFSVTPATERLVEAWIVDVPVVEELIVTWQAPPRVEQFCDAGVPGPEVMFTVHTVPS